MPPSARRNGDHFHRRNFAAVRGGGLLTPSTVPQASVTDDAQEASTDEDDFEDVMPSTSQTQPRADSAGAQLAAARKRRASSVASDEIDEDFEPVNVPELDPVAAAAARAASAAKGKGKGKERAKPPAPDFVGTLEWPQHLKELERVFKALNTVYTFVSARKSFATTFETMKGSIEGLLKRPLEMHDIAQIKSLLPKLVTFAYIDSEALRVHSEGAAAAHDAHKQTREAREKRRREIDALYAEAVGAKQEEGVPRVLLFAFNDGELKSANGVGKVITRRFARKKARQNDTAEQKPRLPEKEPRYTTASMKTLIEKRNIKFHEAVDELLVACAVHEPPQDPVELLLAATDDYLPVNDADESQTGRHSRQGDLEFYLRNPELRPSIEDLLAEMIEDEDYRGQVVENGHKVYEERDPVFGELDEPLSPAVWDALYETRKITALFEHQAKALNALSAGQNVIVSTSTSSGKSLIYQLPVIRALENDQAATAFYVFPTKALAQDQKRSLAELLASTEGLEDVKVATFDGDTPHEDRDYIRDNASVILTNPDMLHVTILPREESWRRFFANLRLVVVDELHTCQGLFGCHVAYIMRRLRRICAAVGNRKIKFVSCSATIANSAEHMETIFGIENVKVIDADGSPAGRKEFVVWNPPYIDDRDIKQGRVSTLSEASRVFRFLMQRGIRAIVFCKVRMQCEMLMKQVRQDLMQEGRADMAKRVMSYRSGYSANDRRQIEQQMFSGQLLGIVATTALELGIDIGSLDAVLTVGFPYTMAGWRQQAGRAGRRNKDALAMLICDPFPIDQHYARNPEALFAAPFAQLALDLDNPIVFEAHVQCAAYEMPIHPVEDSAFFGDKLLGACLERLVEDADGFYHCHPRYTPNPARHVPIRNTEDESYSIVDITDGRNEVVEEVEFSRAIFTIYEGAVFMHQGRSFLVKEVDHEQKLSKVQEASIDWRTRNRDFTDIDAQEPFRIRHIKDSEVTASYGSIKITSIVFGYFKTDRRNNILDTVDLQSPPFIRYSHGFWIDVPRWALDILVIKNIHPAGSIHAAGHALMGLTPLVAMCSEGDVRTECKKPEKELAATPSTRKRPARIILYDSAGTSSGICAKVFDHLSTLLAQACDTIINCKCVEGCPSCVASSVCSGGNMIVSKIGARVVLEAILNRDINVDEIPEQRTVEGTVPGGSIDLRGADHAPRSNDEETAEIAANVYEFLGRSAQRQSASTSAEYRLADSGGFMRD